MEREGGRKRGREKESEGRVCPSIDLFCKIHITALANSRLIDISINFRVSFLQIHPKETLHHTATHCATLHHIATHCNTLQHAATHCHSLQLTTTLRKSFDPTKALVDVVGLGSNEVRRSFQRTRWVSLFKVRGGSLFSKRLTSHRLKR